MRNAEEGSPSQRRLGGFPERTRGGPEWDGGSNRQPIAFSPQIQFASMAFVVGRKQHDRNHHARTTTAPPRGSRSTRGTPGAQDVQDGARGEGRGRGGAWPGRGGVAVGRRRRSRGHGGVMEVRLRDRRSADAISNEPA